MWVFCNLPSCAKTIMAKLKTIMFQVIWALGKIREPKTLWKDSGFEPP